jgi:hypothetical protein
MTTKDLTLNRTTKVTGARKPSTFLELQRELVGRLVSTGGRPADPGPTIRRLITVKKHVWKELQQQAELLSKTGRPVSAGQLAAILLEKGIADLILR